MLRRRFAASVVALILLVSVAAVGQVAFDPIAELQAARADLVSAQGRLDGLGGDVANALARVDNALAALTTTAPTTTTTVATTTTAAPTTTATTLPPTTTTTAAPTTTTAPVTTTTSPPSGCVGVQVAAGANLATVAANNAAGATFCLAAGTYNLTGDGVPLQSGDKWIGAVGPNGERLSILDGGMSAVKAFKCVCSGGEIRNVIVQKFNAPIQSQPFGSGITNFLWDNIESRFNNGRGFFTFDGTILRNSYIHHNQQLGIGGSGDNVLVENNEIAYNNPVGEIMPGFEAGGSKWTNTNGSTIRGNYFHHNCGAAIWFDGSGNSNVLIENNISEDNWGVGIFMELFGANGVVRNNVVSRNTFGSAGVICQNTPGGESTGAGNGGIRINGAAGVEVYGNVLVDNDGGVSSTQDDRKASTGLYVHDNTITWSVGWHGMQKTGGTSDPFSAAANNRYENNDYHYNGSSSTPFKWAGSDRTWTQWRGYGHDDTGTFD